MSRRDNENGGIAPTSRYIVEVRFPLGGTVDIIEDVANDLRSRFPNPDKILTRLDVHLKEGTRVDVVGFGMPFSNPSHASDDWIRRHQPIIGKHTLVDILEQRSFSFIVAGPRKNLEQNWNAPMPPPFRYGYGDKHSWDMARYSEQFATIKGSAFLAAYQFDDDNEHCTAMALSQVQDVVWLDVAARTISEPVFWAYFIPMNPNIPAEKCDDFFAIIPNITQLRDEHASAWRRLAGADNVFTLAIKAGKKGSVNWGAKIADAPGLHTAMALHETNNNSDLVLVVRRPKKEKDDDEEQFEVKTFQSRALANADLKRSHSPR